MSASGMVVWTLMWTLHSTTPLHLEHRWESLERCLHEGEVAQVAAVITRRALSWRCDAIAVE